MTDTPRADEVADYESAVRRHLADLPAPVREDLLADLETHLVEVAADLEPGATLAERLGAPEAYASELREAAEIDEAEGGSPAREKITAALTRVGGVADRFTASAGAGSFAEFWKSLRPAWWVLRGVAAAGLILYALLAAGLISASYYSMGPALAVLAVLVVVCVWFSVRLATRSASWQRPAGRWAVTIGGMALVWVAALSFLDVYTGTAYVPTGSGSDYDPYGHVQDVYPYTEDGELLTDVYLLDQYGSPLFLGDPSRCSMLSEDLFDRDEYDDPYGSEGEYGYQYPLCVADEGDPSSGATDLPQDPTEEFDATTREEASTPEEPATSAEAETPSESASE